jgi:hypothetical protein
MFTMLNRDPLAFISSQQQAASDIGKFYAKQGDMAISGVDNYRTIIGDIIGNQMSNSSGLPLNVYRTQAVYPDQLMPFDITITAANEYGQLGTLRIYGVEILNFGSGISVDDIVTEIQTTFICRAIGRWTPVTATTGFANATWDRINNTFATSALPGVAKDEWESTTEELNSLRRTLA